MAKKVHPHGKLSSSSSSSSSSSPAPCYCSSKQETFTIWMKSLVLNGKGCTVFDSNGHIMYRVDNYNSKHSNEVYLMDSNGRGLFTILRKKFRLFGIWEGYRSITDHKLEKNPENPVFQVKKSFRILRKSSKCEVILGADNNEPCNSMMITSCRLRNKSAGCKILDYLGELVAEVKRKEATNGVVFGEDVWTLEVKPGIDHSLIMGLVVVYSLIYSKM